MPAPVSVPVRQAIWNQWHQGKEVAAIAAKFELAPRTVRHLVRRFRVQGKQGMAPSYEPCGQRRSQNLESVRDESLRLRREHPTWGAGLIRVMLQRNAFASELPTERTLQRWLAAAGLNPAPSGRRPASESRRAQEPHEVWQMDAAERLRLATGQQVSWLRLIDECSGAVLSTTIFPPRVLGSSVADLGPKRFAPGFFPLGTTVALPGRQWGAVGFGR